MSLLREFSKNSDHGSHLFKQGDRGIPTAADASSFLHSLSQGRPDCPLLRASSDHRFIVGALRAQRAAWLPSFFPFRGRALREHGNSLVAPCHPV